MPSSSLTMYADVLSLGLSFVVGEGIGKDGWRESSYLVLGASFDIARALAVTYGQNAFVFVDEKGVPRLVDSRCQEGEGAFVVQANGHLRFKGYDGPPAGLSSDESDALPHDGEEAAFEYFHHVSSVEERNAVGVIVVEGESPADDLQYAMLESSAPVANRVAAAEGFSIRFERE